MTSEYIKKQIAARPLEAELLRKLFSELWQNGHPITRINDGSDLVRVEGLDRRERRESFLELAFNLEEFFAITDEGAWVRIVMERDALDEMVADYTINLESSMQGTFYWAERHSR